MHSPPHTHTLTHTPAHSLPRPPIHSCARTHTHTHTHTHTQTHTHTHTHTNSYIYRPGKKGKHSRKTTHTLIHSYKTTKCTHTHTGLPSVLSISLYLWMK